MHDGQDQNAQALAELAGRTMYERDPASQALGIVLAEIRPGQQAACHLYDSAEESLNHPIYLDKAAGC